MKKIEASRIKLGFFPSEFPNQKMLKQARERRARAMEKGRQGRNERLRMGELEITVATPQDREARSRFELGRTIDHVRQGRATPEETNYLRKHL